MNTNYNEILDIIHKKLIRNGKKFDTVSPDSIAIDGVYSIGDGLGWTESFYNGMLCLDWLRTKDENIEKNIRMQMTEFRQRLRQNRGLNHHDIGFLYTLSAVAAYRLFGDNEYFETAKGAAYLLSKRYHKSGKFIQAWGDPNSRDNYRLIIDCMLNIPLLYWVADETKDAVMFDMAYSHAKTTLENIFREDYSAFHTYYFDYETGKPLYGKTHQGARDDSAWARGQAWAIYGFAISYKYTKDEQFLEAAKKASGFFLNHLPKDKVCYWDLCFGDGSNEPRDTSAAAIAACGLKDIADISGEDKYRVAAKEILDSLCNNYTSDFDSEALLENAVYSMPHNIGVDMPCIWGDYFFMEALTRFTERDYVSFWE